MSVRTSVYCCVLSVFGQSLKIHFSPEAFYIICDYATYGKIDASHANICPTYMYPIYKNMQLYCSPKGRTWSLVDVSQMIYH